MPDQASPDLMMIELEKAAHLKDTNVSHIVRIYREKFADPLAPRYKPTSWKLLEHIGRHKKDFSTAPPVKFRRNSNADKEEV